MIIDMRAYVDRQYRNIHNTLVHHYVSEPMLSKLKKRAQTIMNIKRMYAYDSDDANYTFNSNDNGELFTDFFISWNVLKQTV